MKKDLQITTATVEVRMLTVDGKKMTKATFNQIIEEDALFFDKEKGFFVNGTLIGAVFQGHYIFIVFQNKAKLLRKFLLKKEEDLLFFVLWELFRDNFYNETISSFRKQVYNLVEAFYNKQKYELNNDLINFVYNENTSVKTYSEYTKDWFYRILESVNSSVSCLVDCNIDKLHQNVTEQDICDFKQKCIDYTDLCINKYQNVYYDFVNYLKENHQIFIAT